jgi:ABC-2 type transport system permease protein
MAMAAKLEFQKVYEWEGLRGFSNLFRKENGAWWGTRRWWTNALLWNVLLCGLTAVMLFMQNEEVYQASEAQIAQAGGLVAYIVILGLNVFFEFGTSILAIWTVILSQDLILGEKQNGLTEWLLSKPVTRCAYLLAKLAANALPVLVLLIGLPSVSIYALASVRMGHLFPLVPFLSALGIMAVHMLFYLTLTLMLGTIFNNRGPILGIALSSILGGGLLGGFINQFFSITPWILPKAAWMMATSQALPIEIIIAALVVSTLWSVVFIMVALVKFEKMEC